MRKILTVIALGLLTIAAKAEELPLPYLGSSYDDWMNYMKATGHVTESVGISNIGGSLFKWRVSDTDYVMAEFKAGSSISILFWTTAKWEPKTIHNMVLNATNTQRDYWTDAIRSNDSNGTIFYQTSKDRKMYVRFYLEPKTGEESLWLSYTND